MLDVGRWKLVICMIYKWGGDLIGGNFPRGQFSRVEISGGDFHRGELS